VVTSLLIVLETTIELYQQKDCKKRNVGKGLREYKELVRFYKSFTNWKWEIHNF